MIPSFDKKSEIESPLFELIIELGKIWVHPRYYHLLDNSVFLMFSSFVIVVSLISVICVILKLLLNAEHFVFVYLFWQDCLFIIGTGTMIGIAAWGGVPSEYNEYVEKMHEGLLILCTAALGIKFLSRLCYQFKLCRRISELLSNLIRGRF